ELAARAGLERRTRQGLVHVDARHVKRERNFAGGRELLLRLLDVLEQDEAERVFDQREELIYRAPILGPERPALHVLEKTLGIAPGEQRHFGGRAQLL